VKKWLIGASVTLNVLTLAALVSLSAFGSKLVLKYFLAPGHERRISQFEELPLNPEDIVFLGDSITEGGEWEELFPQLPVRNRGISGDTTAGVRDRLHQVTRGKPAKVFLLIGTNDLANEIAISDIAANTDKIVAAISSASPETRVYVQSVLPRAAEYREKVEALNALLERQSAGKATWINLYPVFLDTADDSIRDDLSNDELHLMGSGYLLWRDAILEQVRQ
jgi:lysophospholipase L1-like esterase